MDATSLAIANMANTQAIIAQQEAAEANRTACLSLISSFKGDTNIQMMQAYARCVNLIYPLSDSTPTAVKILVGSFFIGAILGGIIGYLADDLWLGVIGGLIFFPTAIGVIMAFLWTIGII